MSTVRSSLAALVALLLLAALLPARARAESPWARDAGQGYTHLNFTYFGAYDAVAEGAGELALPRPLTNQTLHAYAEVGVAPRTSVIGSVPFKFLRSGEATAASALDAGALTAFGDIQLGVKHQFLSVGGWAVGAQLEGIVPTSTADPTTGLRSGLGQWGLAPAVAVGHGWDIAYAQVWGSGVLRLGGYDTLVGAGAEGGVHLWKRLWIALVAQGVASLDNGTHVNAVGVTDAGVFLDGEQFLVVGAKVAVDLTPNVGVDVGAYKTLVSEYTPRAFGINAGVSVQW